MMPSTDVFGAGRIARGRKEFSVVRDDRKTSDLPSGGDITGVNEIADGAHSRTGPPDRTGAATIASPEWLACDEASMRLNQLRPVRHRIADR
ncbi:protein of unknown function [Methylorubrum extorquens DM4]|uniref:Uncharacterized protein n=1 Tax=Methylorubrum extorquens (strain DSM 6343 / CIP 106787 / DM4) TaxID=661410 RepID=C7CFA8_METED|nr:protein of unknown function [Methylorubrum extorquens DM4]